MLENVSSVHVTPGTDQVAVAVDSNATVIMLMGANLKGGQTAGDPPAELIVYDGPAADAIILLDITAAAQNNSSPIVPGPIVATKGTIHYTLTGTGATAEIFYTKR